MLAEKPAVQRIKDGKFRKATATTGSSKGHDHSRDKGQG